MLIRLDFEYPSRDQQCFHKYRPFRTHFFLQAKSRPKIVTQLSLDDRLAFLELLNLRVFNRLVSCSSFWSWKAFGVRYTSRFRTNCPRTFYNFQSYFFSFKTTLISSKGYCSILPFSGLAAAGTYTSSNSVLSALMIFYSNTVPVKTCLLRCAPRTFVHLCMSSIFPISVCGKCCAAYSQTCQPCEREQRLWEQPFGEKL